MYQKYLTGTLAIRADPDGLSHYATFHQDFLLLANINFGNYNLYPSKRTMDHTMCIV